jgi:hypothetical protein
MFKTMFFFSVQLCVNPWTVLRQGRPPNVPFFGQERYAFMFLCEKNCACGHGLRGCAGQNLAQSIMRGLALPLAQILLRRCGLRGGRQCKRQEANNIFVGARHRHKKTHIGSAAAARSFSSIASHHHRSRLPPLPPQVPLPLPLPLPPVAIAACCIAACCRL